jgi:hypothetical protein
MGGVPTSPKVVPAGTLMAGHGALLAAARNRRAVGGQWRAAHLLEDVAGDGARARLETLRNGAAHAAAAKDALERANADAISQVHAARDGSGTDVVPIWVVRSELLVHRGLDEIRPLGDLDLADTLQVSSVRDHEVVRRDVLDCHSSRLGHAANAGVQKARPRDPICPSFSNENAVNRNSWVAALSLFLTISQLSVCMCLISVVLLKSRVV